MVKRKPNNLVSLSDVLDVFLATVCTIFFIIICSPVLVNDKILALGIIFLFSPWVWLPMFYRFKKTTIFLLVLSFAGMVIMLYSLSHFKCNWPGVGFYP